MATLQMSEDTARKMYPTASAVLIENIQKVPKDGFPFVTTIVKENEHFEFT